MAVCIELIFLSLHEGEFRKHHQSCLFICLFKHRESKYGLLMQEKKLDVRRLGNN